MTLPTPSRYAFDSATPGLDDPFGRYHDLYSAGTEVKRMSPVFRAQFEVCRLDRLVLFDRRLDGVAHERSVARVSGDGLAHFVLQLVLSGRMQLEHAGGAAEVKPGEIAFFDLTRPQRTRAFDARIITFSVPRDLMESATSHVAGLHGTVLGSDRGGLLAAIMTSMVQQRLAETCPDPVAVVRIFQSALALALRREDDAAPDGGKGEIVDRVRLMVDAHLGRRDLSPAMLAHMTGLSRTQLYACLKPFGGVSRFIQERRVIRLRSLILQTDRRVASIEQLAFQAGFASSSHATRSFVEAYGMAPGRFRDVGAEHLSVSIDPASPFNDWLRSLN